MASSYWKRRAERQMLRVQEQAEKRLTTIGQAMRDAQDYLTQEAASIFRTFANRFGLTEEQARAELTRPIARAEYDRLVARIAALPRGAERTALEVRANSGAYAYRISRAEALKENIAIETARVSQVVEDQLTGQLRFTATEGYAQRMYDLQRQTGSAFAVPDMDALRVAIDTPWSGASYSQRIWGDRDRLAGALEETITGAYLSGKSHAKVARDIQERFGVSFREAERLVRTETSHISNQADLAAYRDAGIEQYEFDAALDSKTCPICGHMDGQVFDVVKAETGENLPPMHPHCRCTTVMADKTKGLQRRGRDANGKNVLLPGDMTYDEWKQWQQAGAPTEIQAWRDAGRATTPEGMRAFSQKQKMIQNVQQDKLQYQTYKELLGTNPITRNFETFQQTKYSDPETYQLVKLDYRRQNTLLRDATLALPNAQTATVADAKFSGYLFNPNNVDGRAKGVAFESRLGYNGDNWKGLQREITRGALRYPGSHKGAIPYGVRYEQRMVLYGTKGTPANVIVGWLVDGNTTHMTSTYIREVSASDQTD